jgi:hypothetical protein
MAVTVSYNALATELEKELTISVTTLEDPTVFKRKLSQAKHRQAIDGKLIFSVSPTVANVNGQTEEAYVISVALSPKRSTVKLITLNKGEGL